MDDLLVNAMRQPVEFNDQHPFDAGKIRCVGRDRMLTTNLAPSARSRSAFHNSRSARLCLRRSERAKSRGDIMHRA